MTNQQLAHELAIANISGKQLPADVLVQEYKKNYKEILKCLKEQTPKAQMHNIQESKRSKLQINVDCIFEHGNGIFC